MNCLLCTNSRRLGLSWARWEHVACETETTLQQEISSQQLQRGTKPIKIFAVIITVREGRMQLVCNSRGSNHTTTGCWILFNSTGVNLSCYWILHIPTICVPSLGHRTDLDMDGVWECELSRSRHIAYRRHYQHSKQHAFCRGFLEPFLQQCS